jgi:4-nitrophenyl phosphatase
MNPIPIQSIRNFIVDMDGVLWHGDKPLPGMREFFATLRANDLRFVLATNNAGKTGAEYVAKLAKLGVAVRLDEILTSPQATAVYLAGHDAQRGTRAPLKIYVVGSASLATELQAQGLHVVAHTAAPSANCVVVGGIVGNLTYENLAEACLLIRAGALFVGTNPDVTYPGERGIIPGNGAILEALRVATGVSPLVIGKPQPEMMVQAMRRMGGDASNTAVIGDRLDTDILGGKNAGLTALVVLSGVTSAEQAKADAIRADYVFEDIGAVAGAVAQTR